MVLLITQDYLAEVVAAVVVTAVAALHDGLSSVNRNSLGC